MTTSHPKLTRRRCHQLAGAALLTVLLPGLGACAGNGPSAVGHTVSQRQLNQWLAAAFPVTRNFAGLADLTLQSPRLNLLPASNRVATAFDLVLTERLAGSRFTGGMDLDGGLRFDLNEGAVRMTDVRVNRLSIDQLPAAQQRLVSQYAPALAEQLLQDFVLYRLPAEQVALARNLGWTQAVLRVLPNGLHIEPALGTLR